MDPTFQPSKAMPEETEASKRVMERIGKRMLKRRVDALKSLPTFPESIMRINEVLLRGDGHQSLEQIARVIEADPVVTARTLRLVNSAFYGVSGAIASVYDALLMLGLDVVRGIILSTTAMELASGQSGIRGLWEHSYGCAVAATALGRELGLPRVEELSAAALMHDLGKLVFASQLGREYDEVVAHAVRHDECIRDVEEKMLGVSHDLIGEWLVTRWRFPLALAEPIALHHTPEKAKRYPEACAVVHVADILVRGYGFGFAGDHIMPELSTKAWKRLRLNGKTLNAVIRRMHDDLQVAMAQANLYVFE
ncbi:MAG: HDOD domain-containing protein [Myxococcota bacterium]|nr:HDOD domain-containing protein [Myxococcota bacterium]